MKQEKDKNKKILCIEDNALILSMIRDLLSTAGYEVQESTFS